jgi:hypothetical protein
MPSIIAMFAKYSTLAIRMLAMFQACTAHIPLLKILTSSKQNPKDQGYYSAFDYKSRPADLLGLPEEDKRQSIKSYLSAKSIGWNRLQLGKIDFAKELPKV